eukprot:TRINITY_DN40976_c0_g1_i1.p1 TRINITY_DN40976_c0_g1~~TRINITY_DN40976_c0_g1_i1.p1  ORF type:complete len:385 (-),score=50.90 TRINITY_DN40976_c0_g1_i1:333-1364(-)
MAAAAAQGHGRLPSPIPFSALLADRFTSDAALLRWRQTSQAAVANSFESYMTNMTERSREYFFKHRPDNADGLVNAYLTIGGTSREHTIGKLMGLFETLKLPLHLLWKAMQYLDTFYVKVAKTKTADPLLCPDTLAIAACLVAAKAHRQQGQTAYNTDSSVFAVRSLLESSSKPKEAVFALEMQLLETIDFEIASPGLFDILDGMTAYLMALGGCATVGETAQKIAACLFLDANLVFTFEPGALAAAAVILTLHCPSLSPPPAMQLAIHSALQHMLCQSSAESFNRHLIYTCVGALRSFPTSDSGTYHPRVSALHRGVLEMWRPTTSSVNEQGYTVTGHEAQT